MLSYIYKGVIFAAIIVIACPEYFIYNDNNEINLLHSFCPPQKIKYDKSIGFYINPIKYRIDNTYRRTSVLVEDIKIPLSFFCKTDEFYIFNTFKISHKFFGINRASYNLLNKTISANSPVPSFYLFGADIMGRDILARTIYASKISIIVSVIGVIITAFIGIVIGSISGFVGGKFDFIIQRIVDILSSIPSLPIFMALAVAMPRDITQIQSYLFVVIIISFLSWYNFSKTIRAKVLSILNEDYILAARLTGASEIWVFTRHVYPVLRKYVLAVILISLPTMILAESALSFLGIGLRPPATSWGVLLQEASNVNVILNYPWLLIPAFVLVLFVIIINKISATINQNSSL